MGSSGESPDFFVSYAGPDRPWARWMTAVLEAAGFRVEFDEWDWGPGLDVVARMNAAIERADRVLALCSPRYFDPASWAREEVSAALHLAHERPGSLVPVVVEPVSLPPLLRSLARIDLSGRAEDDAARELLARLRGEVERGRPQPFPSGATCVRFPRALPAVWRVPPRNPNFTGREAILERLHAQLKSDDTVVVYAMHGMGGVGKTQMAIEYAFRFASEYDLVWWLDAEQPALVPDQFAQLAERLGLPAGVSASEAVTLALETLGQRDRWLLVFDNVERPEDILQFRPSTVTGRVIVTSRHPGWGGIGRRLEVDVFTRSESVAFLSRRIPQGSGVADELANELGDLPLALEQAAGYIETTGTSPEKYLALWRTQRERLLDAGIVADHALLDATWAVSLARLRETAPAAIEILQISAFLGPEPVPQWLLTSGVPTERLAETATDEFALEQALGQLSAYAVIRRTTDDYSVHRLVQLAVRRSMTVEARQDAVIAVLTMLEHAVPEDIIDQPTTWPAWRLLLPHVLAVTLDSSRTAEGADSDLTSWLLDRAATYLQARGVFQLARELFVRALELAERVHGPNHASVGTRLNNLALVLDELGESEAALPLLTRALRIAETTARPGDPIVAIRLWNLGSALRKLGRPREARPLFERALELVETTSSVDETKVAVGLANLAHVLSDLGEDDRARELLERAAGVMGEAVDPEDVRIAISRINLAEQHRRAGELEIARDLLSRALPTIERAYGPEHPNFATVTGNLGMVISELGDPAAARPLLEKALEVDERAYGQMHPSVGTSLSNLGLTLLALDDPIQARVLFERALDIFERAHDPEHMAVAIALGNLATTLIRLGLPREAQPLLERSLRIRARARQTDVP